MQPIHEFGGDGPMLTLAVANGFPPQTYNPLIQPFTDDYRVVGMLPRALWWLYGAAAESPPAKRMTWRHTVGMDLLAGLREHDLRDVIGIGHSFGGIATLVAAVEDPARFKALILLDPTIMPGIRLAVMWLNRQLGTDWKNVLAQRAEKRRETFDSNAAAYEYFKGKRLFSGWPDAAMRGYTDPMPPLDPGQPDGPVTLAWPREWEAYYFRTIHTGAWAELPKLRKTGVPTLIIRGGSSDTLLPGAVQAIQRQLPGMSYREIDGHGHLFPQTAPTQTATLIREWLAEL